MNLATVSSTWQSPPFSSPGPSLPTALPLSVFSSWGPPETIVPVPVAWGSAPLQSLSEPRPGIMRGWRLSGFRTPGQCTGNGPWMSQQLKIHKYERLSSKSHAWSVVDLGTWERRDPWRNMGSCLGCWRIPLSTQRDSHSFCHGPGVMETLSTMGRESWEAASRKMWLRDLWKRPEQLNALDAETWAGVSRKIWTLLLPHFTWKSTKHSVQHWRQQKIIWISTLPCTSCDHLMSLRLPYSNPVSCFTCLGLSFLICEMGLGVNILWILFPLYSFLPPLLLPPPLLLISFFTQLS